jgi:predicted ATPase
VGRREQLAALDDAVGQAATGLPQFVVFSGDAEIGKTRLMTHFAYRIEQAGFWVLRTGCVELGAARLPLVPLKTALRQLVDQLGVEMLRETQAGIDALLRLLPEFGALAPGADDPTTLFDRFGALLAHLGTEHPLLWLIDDLHWADRSAASCSGS